MRIQRIGSIGLLSLALCAADAAAQGGGGAVVAQERQVIVNGVPQGDIQLPGMPGRNFKTGTGRIRGRVVASDNGAPVPKPSLGGVASGGTPSKSHAAQAWLFTLS